MAILVAVFLSICVSILHAFHEPSKFLVVSSASSHKVAYTVLKNGAAEGFTMRPLITGGLSNPQGIAVDDARLKLYVADPSLGKLVYYPLTVSGDTLSVGSQTLAVSSVETRWVTVDSLGNVYFTVESNQQIMKLSSKSIDAGSNDAEVLYNGAYSPLVSSPGGIATDNFYVYWTNKASGTQVGSIMKADSDGTDGNASPSATANLVSPLTKNAVKTYGVCFASNGVMYYTDEVANLYGLQLQGGSSAPVTVSSGFVSPRGCAFDGDGTVYVADKYLNAVYGFAAPTQKPQAGTLMLKTVDLQGAFGVAVFGR